MGMDLSESKSPSLCKIQIQILNCFYIHVIKFVDLFKFVTAQPTFLLFFANKSNKLGYHDVFALLGKIEQLEVKHLSLSLSLNTFPHLYQKNSTFFTFFISILKKVLSFISMSFVNQLNYGEIIWYYTT